MLITTALIIKLASAALGGAATVGVVVLNWAQILDWFQARRTRVPAVEKTKIYFTVLDLLAGQNYNTIQGVLDTRSQQLADVRSIRSKYVDAQLAHHHRHHQLAVYK